MYDPLKYYCPKCNTECAGICPSCGYSDHNPTMYKKEIVINNTSISIPSLMASYAKYIRRREQGFEDDPD